MSAAFRHLAQHLGITLLSGDAQKLIDFANEVSRQTRDQTVEVCARIAETMPRVWDVKAPDPQTRIATAIRKLVPQKETHERN